jgi:tetratricopeptide (TPR) repeat protein
MREDSCSQCHAPLLPGDEFCGECGHPVAPAPPRAEPLPPAAGPAPSSQPHPVRWATVVIAGLSIAAALAGAGWLWRSGTLPKLGLPGFSNAPSAAAYRPSGPIVQIPPAVLLRGGAEDGPAEVPRKVSPADVAKVSQELERHPRDPKVLNDAGCIIAAAGDVGRGIQLLDDAHKLAPDDPSIGYNLARGMYQQGKVDDAVKQAGEVLKQKPGMDEARLLRATAAVAKKDYRAAEDDLSKLVRRIQLAAFLIEGAIQLAEGKPREAQASFEQAIKLASNNPVALYNAGVASQQNNNLALAANYYRQAIALDPSLAEAHNNLGTVLMQSGNPQGAFEEFHAAALQTSDGAMLANLANSSQGLGQSQDKIVGAWVIEGGSWDISGSVQGQALSQSIPMPPGSRITLTKAGEGSYRADESIGGMTGTAVFTLRPNGSYEAAAAVPPELARMLPPSVTDTGTVSFWVGGNTLFGDTKETVSGPNISLKSAKTWKATRVM